jgi:predicted phage tail protein
MQGGLNTIRLHGDLGEQFGSEYELAVDTTREAFTALCSQLDGFEDIVRAGYYRITRTKKSDVTELDEDLIDLRLTECVIDVYPVVAGAASNTAKGIGKIIAGIALIAVAIFVPFLAPYAADLIVAGAAMALGGVAMLLAPAPKAAKAAEKTDSYTIGSLQNTMQQGGAVTLIYGHVLIGSTVISQEITIDQLLGSGQTYDVDNIFTEWGFPNFPNTSNHLN